MPAPQTALLRGAPRWQCDTVEVADFPQSQFGTGARTRPSIQSIVSIYTVIAKIPITVLYTVQL